jgi:hypothetical protein
MSVRNTRGNISLGSLDNSKFISCTLPILTSEFGAEMGSRLFKLIARADSIKNSVLRDSAIGMAVWDVFGMDWQNFIGSVQKVRSTLTPESTVH